MNELNILGVRGIKQLSYLGDCILCGSRVMNTSEFYETGEGFAHEFCMHHRRVAR